MSSKEEQIEIRMMRPDEEPKLLAFMKANLDTWDTFEKLWKWRQENREISGGETAAIAKKEGKIVGCVGIVERQASKSILAAGLTRFPIYERERARQKACGRGFKGLGSGNG